MIIFKKFHEDRTKTVDFSLIANFRMCLIFYDSDFSFSFYFIFYLFTIFRTQWRNEKTTSPTATRTASGKTNGFVKYGTTYINVFRYSNLGLNPSGQHPQLHQVLTPLINKYILRRQGYFQRDVIHPCSSRGYKSASSKK